MPPAQDERRPVPGGQPAEHGPHLARVLGAQGAALGIGAEAHAARDAQPARPQGRAAGPAAWPEGRQGRRGRQRVPEAPGAAREPLEGLPADEGPVAQRVQADVGGDAVDPPPHVVRPEVGQGLVDLQERRPGSGHGRARRRP